MSLLWIAILVFVAVQAILGLVLFVLNDKGGKVNDRLDLITGKRKKEDEQATILRKNALDRDKKSLLAFLMPNIPSLQKIIAQADANISPSTLAGIGGILALVGFTAGVLASGRIWLGPISALIFFMIPFAWLLNKRKSRLRKFASQLSEGLELVARALRAGHSLAAGLHVVAEEMPPPISQEFGRVFDEQNLGIPVEDSLKNLCERVPNLDLRFFVTSVLVQRQTGGDLAEILDKIGYVIRERYRILGQVAALTAEGRLSGVILVALPFCLFLVMLYIKPDYVEKLWTHPLGIKMAVVGLIMQVVGALVIRKVIDIKV